MNLILFKSDFHEKKFSFKDLCFVYLCPCVSITQYFFPGLSVGFINLLYLQWKTLEQVSSSLWLIFSDAVETVVLLFSCLTQLFSFTFPLSLCLALFSPCHFFCLSDCLSLISSKIQSVFPLFFCLLDLSYFSPL